eukprot:Lithocolla_globosa_v1_NODE_629_length_3565_cov_4.135897.p1 type:complete len:808 gc:universal NODE_629_length_3565_cov_4.135897:1050-3473(+)
MCVDDDCVGKCTVEGAKCQDTIPGYLCYCSSGYQGSVEQNVEVTCEDLDCTSRCTAPGNSPCKDIIGGYECGCEEGYVGVPIQNQEATCLDLGCAQPAVCTALGNLCYPTFPGYECGCAEGYEGTNVFLGNADCQDVTCENKCTGEFNICVDLNPGYRCDCSGGYVGESVVNGNAICVDENCTGKCLGNYNYCTDLQPGYMCSCQLGYVGDAVRDGNAVCIDESCAGKCVAPGNECRNLDPGYECLCSAGYSGATVQNGLANCSDLSCDEFKCTAEGNTCLDLEPGFLCQCTESYVGETVQNENASCSPATCDDKPCQGENVECKDLEPGYECICADGFEGDTLVNAGSPVCSKVEKQSSPVGPGLILGLIGATFLLLMLCLLCFVVSLIRQRKKEEQEIMETMPDFVPVAFSLGGYADLPMDALTVQLDGLILAPGFPVFISFAESADASDLVSLMRGLMYHAHAKGVSMDAVSALILRDLQFKQANGTLTEQTLFRENSPASAAFKQYAKMVGLPYLWWTLKEPVLSCVDVTSSDLPSRSNTVKRKSMARRSQSSQVNLLNMSSVELDPTKLKETDDSEVNKLALQLTCQVFLQKIFRSITCFPLPLRKLLQEIHQHTSEFMGPAIANKAVASFIFLRFINPAILLPQSFCVISPQLTISSNRQLVLVTKVLQNLANGVEFGKKEAFMADMNPFIKNNRAPLDHFIREILSESTVDHRPENILDRMRSTHAPDVLFQPLDMPPPIQPQARVVIANHLHYNSEKIYQVLRTLEPEKQSLEQVGLLQDIKEGLKLPIKKTNVPPSYP